MWWLGWASKLSTGSKTGKGHWWQKKKNVEDSERYIKLTFTFYLLLKIIMYTIEVYFLNQQFWEFLFLFYFIFKLYNIVLVLPNIEMNPPQVYTCSPSWTLLPPHTIPLGRPSAPAPSIQYRASNLDWRLISYMILYMFQCQSPKSSHPLPLPQSP